MNAPSVPTVRDAVLAVLWKRAGDYLTVSEIVFSDQMDRAETLQALRALAVEGRVDRDVHFDANGGGPMLERWRARR